MAAEPLFVVTPEVEERLRFETLLTDISSRFVNVPADCVDQEIQNARNLVRDQGVGGSNPLSPTNYFLQYTDGMRALKSTQLDLAQVL